MTVRDFQGRLIKLTSEQWNNDVLLQHSYMAGMEQVVRETLEDPEEVRKSVSFPDTSRLYYKWYTGTVRGDRWVCVVVKVLKDEAFISTAYTTDRIIQGELIWRKES
jgi:hypothetical protein